MTTAEMTMHDRIDAAVQSRWRFVNEIAVATGYTPEQIGLHLQAMEREGSVETTTEGFLQAWRRKPLGGRRD